MLDNVLIFLIVVFSPTLDAPMYFFSWLLLIYGCCLFYHSHQNMIIALLCEKKTTSIQVYMTQLFIGHWCGGAEISHLVVIAYDHYVGIYKPLQNLTIMNQQLCILLLLWAWIGGFSHGVFHPLLFTTFPSVSQCHWPLQLWHIHLVQTCLHWHPCFCPHGADQWWDLWCGPLYTPTCLLCGHSVLPEESYSGWGAESLTTSGSHITALALFFVPCFLSVWDLPPP